MPISRKWRMMFLRFFSRNCHHASSGRARSVPDRITVPPSSMRYDSFRGGRSAGYAAVAASFFSPVKLVGGVGEDFPKKCLALYGRHKINLEGLQILPGKTFHWSGEYELNMNNRRTLATELGVIETYSPTLPK